MTGEARSACPLSLVRAGVNPGATTNDVVVLALLSVMRAWFGADQRRPKSLDSK